MGVQIACFIISEKDFTEKHCLYEKHEECWKDEYKLLFNLASEFKKESDFYSEILNVAEENNWSVPLKPKMFFQVNQTETLNELIDMILSPLQNNK